METSSPKRYIKRLLLILLIQLNLLTLMYQYELSDLLFFIKSYKTPYPHFDINNYISMKPFLSTRSSSSSKLVHHNISSTNSNRHFYFCRLPRLWNTLPSINLNFPYMTIKNQLIQFLWHHFLNILTPATLVHFIFVVPVLPVLPTPFTL